MWLDVSFRLGSIARVGSSDTPLCIVRRKNAIEFLSIMGCAGQSKVQPVDTAVETYRYMDLTDGQVELVRASWNLVQDNLLGTGLIIYDK